MPYVMANSPKHETDVKLESQEFVFSSGDRIMLRHVNSILVRSRNNGWVYTILLFLVSGLLIFVKLELGILGFIIGVLPVAFGEKWFIAITSSSSQVWWVFANDKDHALKLSEDLQLKIRGVFDGSEQHIDGTARQTEPTNIVTELEKLKSLHDSGTLSDDEFQKAKDRLLSNAA